ncbi:MAG: hypothetical protein ACK5KR_03920 [Breznakia sp.]
MFEADQKDTLTIHTQENKSVAWFDCEQVLHMNKEKAMIPIYKKLLQKTRKL